MIVIDVLGHPAPKGNARAFVNKRTGRAILSSFGSGSTEKRLRSWDASVREEAWASCRDHFHGQPATSIRTPMFVNQPLRVSIVFRIARPAGHWGTGKNAGRLKPGSPSVPSTKPDADKLARATLDSLHGCVFDDDSRIVELAIVKRYATPGREGARITVEEWRAS